MINRWSLSGALSRGCVDNSENREHIEKQLHRGGYRDKNVKELSYFSSFENYIVLFLIKKRIHVFSSYRKHNCLII